MRTGGVLAWRWSCASAAPRRQRAPRNRWPTKPVRAILPFAPGTGADVVFRLVFNQLSIQLGQQIVVENRGGAGGTIGTAAVAKADPDGYTILGHSTSHTIAPAIYPNMPYDVARDFAAVAAFGRMPTALIMAPSKGIKTIQRVRRRRQGQARRAFTFASAGVGSTTHLTAERFRLSAGFEAVHVPFRGGGFRPEVASGRVDFALFADRGRGARHPRRPAAGARCQQQGSAPRRCPTFRPRWRPAIRIPTTRFGSACSCRSRRRARSSTGCTRKP